MNSLARWQAFADDGAGLHVERGEQPTMTHDYKRDVFKSVAELEAAIHDYLAKNNASPKPFVWTKTADIILEKNERARAVLNAVKSGSQALESEH